MKLSELLVPAAIRLRLQARTKREAIAELVELLETAHGCHSQGEPLQPASFQRPAEPAPESPGVGNPLRRTGTGDAINPLRTR